MPSTFYQKIRKINADRIAHCFRLFLEFFTAMYTFNSQALSSSLSLISIVIIGDEKLDVLFSDSTGEEHLYVK